MIRTVSGGVMAALMLAGAALAQTPTKDGAEFLVNSTTNSSQFEPRAAALSGGGFVITWRDNSGAVPDASGNSIRARLHDAAGAAAGLDFVVNSTTAQDQASPDIAALDGGGFVITWRDNSRGAGFSDIRAQRYDAAAATVGGEFVVNTTAADTRGTPGIAALAGGGFVITWRSDDATVDGSGTAILALRYDSAGAALDANEFLVNSTTTNDQSEPSVAGLDGGGFVISWTDASSTVSDVRAQRYTAAGGADGAEFLVNSTTSNSQDESSVAALNGGGFVISWTGASLNPGDISGLAVRAQRYTAAGATVGGEFLVNTTTTNDQSEPSVAGFDGGGFVISWSDASTTAGDASGRAILAQRFDAAGATDGDEFLVNTTIANSQSQSSVAALSGGGLVIAWTDDSTTGGDTSSAAIRAQRFTLPAPEFLARAGGSDFQNQTIASEVDATLAGDVIIDFGLDGAFGAMGAGGVVEVDFTLNNATFDGIVPANAWTAAADADCDFGSPAFGGGAGGNTVRFENTGQLNLCSGGGANTGFITLPIEVTSNGDPVSLNVTFTPTADAGIYTGSDDDVALMDFAPAFDFSITAGAAGTGVFDTNGDDLLGTGLIGSVALADFPAVINVDLSTPLANATDIANSAELVITFPGGVTGIDTANIDLGGVACTQGVGPANNVFTCALGGGILDAIDNGAAGLDITIDDDGDALTAVTAQTPSAVLTVTPNLGNTVAGASGDLAEIEIDDDISVTSTGSSFAWVRIGSGGTDSNFRMAFASQAEASAVDEIRVTVTSGNGVSAQIITLTRTNNVNTGFRQLGATLTFNSAALGHVAGGSGNADITDVSLTHDDVILEVGDVPGVLRQLVNRTPGSFVATPGLGSDN